MNSANNTATGDDMNAATTATAALNFLKHLRTFSNIPEPTRDGLTVSVGPHHVTFEDSPAGVRGACWGKRDRKLGKATNDAMQDATAGALAAALYTPGRYL